MIASFDLFHHAFPPFPTIHSSILLMSRYFPSTSGFSASHRDIHNTSYYLKRSYLTPFTVTGPVARFARQIASQGYIVAAPSSYHEFTGPEALAYDGPGTDRGNEWKITKTVEAYDEDATLSIDTLLNLETCNGRVGATGKHLLFTLLPLPSIYGRGQAETG